MERLDVSVLSVDRAKCERYGMCEQATPKLLRLDEDDEFVIDAVAITAPTGRCRCGCPRVPCGGSAHRERFGALATLIERVVVGASQADCGCPAE